MIAVAAAKTGRTNGSIVDESLRLRGIQLMSSAKGLVAKARTNAKLTEENALKIALDETRQVRQKRLKWFCVEIN